MALPEYEKNRNRMKQNILWSGTAVMNENQSANLKQNVSKQNNGIVLAWSDYSNGQANDYNFNCFFIPKELIALKNGYGITNIMAGSYFSQIATKYLKVYDNKITGITENAQTGTQNGITYNNNRFVLRYVIGV